MKRNHNYFSNLAFNLAENQIGKTSNNPSVGCVVVKNNSIISTGVTSLNGRPHAEFNALNKSINFKGSTMYVTLEPCTHYGLTPPCTNIIKRKKISKVFYSFDDPDLRTSRKAKTKLKRYKIKISKVKQIKNDFYKSYFLNKKHMTTFVDAKLAISKDYYTINKRSKWITNLRSRSVGHLLRSKYDSILSTSASINNDNSILNCRIDGFNNFKPDLIIIDRNLRLKKDLKLLRFAKKRNTYIFTESKNKKKISFFKKKKIKIIKIDKLNDKNDFQILFKKIFKIGKGRILIESGLVFLNELIKFKLINDLYLFKTNKKLGKKGYNNTKIDYIKNLKTKREIKVNLGEDRLFKLRLNNV